MTMLSRVADCLYWMSRYIERAEHTARALDVQLNLALDEAPWSASVGWVCLLGGLRADLPMEKCTDAQAITHALALDRSNSSSVVCCIANARENARQVRESITSEMWEEINHLHLSFRKLDIDQLWTMGPQSVLQSVHRGGQMIAGIIDSTMSHGEGWQFLRLGRYMERAIAITWLLDSHFGMKGTEFVKDPTADDFVAWAGLLRMFSAFEPYCKLYTVELHPHRILEFLMFNREFPHSLQFAVQQIDASLAALAEWTGAPRNSVLRRLSGRLTSQLSYATIEEVLSGDLSAYLREIVTHCIEIHNALYEQFISYTVVAALRNEPREAWVEA